MTKKIVYTLSAVLIGCLSVPATLLADETTKVESHIASAHSQLKAQLAKINDLHAEFQQRVIDEQDNQIMAGAGIVKLKRPEMLYWQQTSPDETLLVSNGEKTYFYDEFAEQVTILNGKQLINSTPFALLTSDDPLLWQQYNVDLHQATYTITPISEQSGQVEKLEIRFDLDTLSRMTVYDNTGQISVYSFSNRQANQGVDNATFQFTVPEGVLIDDQSQGE